MKRMAAGLFKVHCLAVMDEVHSKRETVVVTKRGKPVVKLVPADPFVLTSTLQGETGMAVIPCTQAKPVFFVLFQFAAAILATAANSHL